MRTPRINIFVSAVFALSSMWGCSSGSPVVNRVQTNLVDKSIFEGEFWLLQTVVDADADATGPTWTGDMGADIGVNGSTGGNAVGRIRFVIDEDFLFAYRSFELVEGANTDGKDPSYRGQPLAAFEILDHVDVRPDYNPITGENLNVLEENTEDRRWFERQYMRVDWSKNHVASFFFPAELAALGKWKIEPGSFFVQEDGAHGDFPKAWEPQFVRIGEDPGYRFSSDWPEGSEDVTHYFSFVTFMKLSPGDSCLYIGGGPCQTYSVPHRTAFLRIPPNHEYAAATETHEEFDDFGVIRFEQRTYSRGGRDPSEIARRCDKDADCGTGGFCDASQHVCAGGLTGDYGETDALTFYRSRHNLFLRSFTDQECRVDWECNGRYGEPGTAGSVCDRSARRCTIPIADREIRPVSYHLNAGFPKHLVHPSYEVMGNWNEVFMRGLRAAKNQPLPDYDAIDLPCQNTDPTRYCFCGSPDDTGGGSCKGKYDPFVSPDRWQSMGVRNAYACHIENNEFSEPSSPTSFDDYPIPAAYRYSFVGDECLFTLKTNSCDWYRSDAAQSCDEIVNDEGNEVAWEQLGDLRYQFYNYIDQVNTPFGGVAYVLADPTNGELLASNVNFSAGSVESMATRALDFFPVLRCSSEAGCEPGDEGAEDRYLTGENVRGYFSRLGNTEHPVGLASSGADGFSVDDISRPAIRADVGASLREAMARAEPRTSPLRGREGRALIMSDRMRRLAGTSIEHGLVGSLGANGFEALQRHFDHGQQTVLGLDPSVSVHDEEVLDQISPFRGRGFLRSLTAGIETENELSSRFMCPFNHSLFRSRYWEYFAEAFRGRSSAEASIRMQQLYTKMVQHHEVGHGVGLEHNFAASFDRDHYGDGYFNGVFGAIGDAGGLPLPRMNDFDTDEDGFVAREEFNAFTDELRRVRNERSSLGLHNYMSSSTMDYAGDTSDVQGLGRYDVAATVWNYFDLKEAYVGDPSTDKRGPFQGLKRSHDADRVWWQSYLGGERCEVDAQCPYSEVSGTLSDGQAVYQRCVKNPRQTGLQFPCAGDDNCVCSNFKADVQDFFDDAAYEPDANNDGKVDYAPISYLFCTNSRVNDISWCNMFDAGESFREAIDHFRRSWEERYPADYYRRFRAFGPRSGGTVGSIIDAAKIYQHLFFRYNFEPGFSFDEGPLGFDDQFLASVDAMNWLIEIANLPDEGSYAMSPGNAYRWIGEDIDLPGSDFSLLPGEGFGMWTKYQDGYFGFFRPERAGVFYDKYAAMLALAIRDWGFSFTVDERYFINFYDLFPTEMTEFFGGVVLQDETWFAPRVMDDGGDVKIKHMSWYRGIALGECDAGEGSLAPCRRNQAEVYPQPVLEGTSNEILRSWGAILALAQFPVYYDTTFQQRLQIFKLGSGAGFEIPDFQNDGSPTCVYGTDALQAGHVVVDPDVLNECDVAEDADYVAYASQRLRTPYIAVKVRPSLAFNLEEEQLGFQVLRRLVDLQERVGTLSSGPERDLTMIELQQAESFLEYLIDLQAAYGISNIFVD